MSDNIDDIGIPKLNAPQSKPVILIVDDTPDYARLFDLIADALGVSVRIVNSCLEAIQTLEQEPVDIIIMDWLMPDVNGPMCARRIRSIERHTDRHATIIGVSGFDGATRAGCLESGMDDYLAIPFTLEELHDKLDFWLQRKKQISGEAERVEV